jgi:hypothetical protein
MSMRFLYDNDFDDYTPTANSTETGYSVTNVQDYQLSKRYRATDDSTEWVLIDAGTGATVSADSAAVCSHNFSTAGTFKIQAASNSSELGTTDGLLDEAIAHSTGIMTEFFDATTARFWRFYFEDDTNSDGYLEMGRLYLGTYFSPENEASFDWPLQLVDTSVAKFSITGEVFGDEGNIHRLLTYNFSNIDNDDRKNFATFFEEVKTVKPFVFLYKSTALSSLEALYCVVNDNLAHNHLIEFYYNGTLSLREVL